MSSCDDGVCGTGGFAGPKPGDPNSISTFTATPGYGGINLNWLLPTINPYAVAHVRIFRATSSNAAQATLLQTVHGDFYFDIVAIGTTYYYWLEVVSVNGTYDTWIGPASAAAMDSIEKTIQDISGRIDSGVLAQSLRDEIGEITLLGNTISQEVTDRIAAINGVASALGGLQGQLTNAITIVEQEVQQRIDGDGAIVTQLDLWAAGFDTAIAGIAEEVNLQVGPEGALAERVTTAEVSLYGNVATAEVGLVTKVEGHNGVITDIGALWTAKLSVNGLIGGFGVYNDGKNVEAGFDVDTFWIGKSTLNTAWVSNVSYVVGNIVSNQGVNWICLLNHTSNNTTLKPPTIPTTANTYWKRYYNAVKPFIVDNEVVYINDAAINKLTFSKLRDEQGTFIVQNGKVKANYIDTNGLIIRDINGNPIFGSGTLLTLDFITGLGSFATKSALQFTELTGSKPAIDATNGAPAGTFVNGVAVATLTSNAADGLSAFTGTVKYRTTGAPTNSPVGTGITITTNTNGSCNIRLDWAAYSQGTKQADFILLLWTKDGNAPGLADSSILLNVSTSASYYVFEGVNPSDTYSFGIAAGRRTESGIELTAIHAPTSAPDWRGVTGGTPNFTANINGVSANVIQTATSNFNNRNDRNATAIVTPTVLGNGTAIEHSANTDGSVDISFEWNWTGTNSDIDGWIIYVHTAGTSTPYYVFGTSSAAESLNYTTPEKRAFIMFGVAADKYYTFGVQGYRIVDTDVNAAGIIKSAIVSSALSTDNPYRPAATVGFAGDITGTINSTSAATVISNASNGNVAYSGTSKYRTAIAPSNTPSFGSITESQTADGNVVITVPYNYVQGTYPADKIYLYYREGGGTPTATDVAMATSPVSGVANFILKPNTTYGFGLQAVRTVDNGPIATSIVGSGNVTTSSALYSGSIDGTASVAGKSASLIVSAVNNFNAANDRNASSVTAPTLDNTGSCIDHTIQTDASADISFEWNWSGTEGDIDGFQVYIYQSNSSASYTMGSNVGVETVYEVPAAKRAFIFYGVSANSYYTFGVRAYRKVDKDIAPAGIIASSIVQSSYAGENPYRPTVSIAFAGNVTGTINGTPAGRMNDWQFISGTGRPADYADVTANNTAAGIANQGALATASHVFVGSTVKFANGDVMNTADFVNKLAKIGTGNIGTFIDGLAITDAYIGNAAIKTAKIDDLAVNTIKIGNSAVTIASSQTWSTTTEGTGSDIEVGSISITLDYPGNLFVMCGGYIGYGSGWRNVTSSLWVNGSLVARGGGAEGWTNHTMMATLQNQPAGTYTVTTSFQGASGSRIYNPSLYAGGTKK